MKRITNSNTALHLLCSYGLTLTIGVALVLLPACEKSRKEDSFKKGLIVEYTTRVALSDTEADPRILEGRASVEEMKKAIAELRKKDSELVTLVEELLAGDIEVLMQGDLATDDSIIVSGILRHISWVEELAMGRAVITVIDEDKPPEQQDELILGYYAYKSWATGMLGYGVVGWEPLERWPSNLELIREGGNRGYLRGEQDSLIIPGLRFVRFKKIGINIASMLIGIGTGDSTLTGYALDELKETTGQDFGYDINRWRDWWIKNENKSFQYD